MVATIPVPQPFPSSVGVYRRVSAIGGTNRKATVDWDAPTVNTAGQSFDNSTNDRTLSGYRIYYGTNEAQVLAGTSSVQNVSAGTTIYTFNGLADGTWHFRVVAYDADGDESNTGASATTYTKVIA